MKRKPKWERKGVLERLMRIAEEARESTFVTKIDKNGEVTREYDTKCAAIELKAVEFAVKITGLFEEEKDATVTVVMEDDASGYAI